MVFSMNVFKNKKNVGKIKNVKKRKKRALNKKTLKNVFFTSMAHGDWYTAQNTTPTNTATFATASVSVVSPEEAAD